jgi:putative endonuclease
VSDPRHLLGRRAEDATAAWLAAAGWTILARRWRRPAGELDLVCRDPDGVLVAVEVKLRSGERMGRPADSVVGRRIRRLRAALGSYASSERVPTPMGLRIDLVAVTPAGTVWRLARYASIDAW